MTGKRPILTALCVRQLSPESREGHSKDLMGVASGLQEPVQDWSRRRLGGGAPQVQGMGAFRNYPAGHLAERRRRTWDCLCGPRQCHEDVLASCRVDAQCECPE